MVVKASRIGSRSDARDWPGTAARMFVWLAIGASLYVAHAAFIPVALALLFALILSGPVEMLHRRRVPRSLSALLILVVALSVLGSAVALLWTPAQHWFANAPQTLSVIKQKVRPVEQFLDHLDDLRNAGSTHAAPPRSPAPAATPLQSAPVLLLDATGPLLAAMATFVIVTLFLLTGGPPMSARMTAAFFDNLNASHALTIIEKVRAEVSSFYLVTTLINLALGVATGLCMWAWGMPTPYLWGALAALVNYVPYAGAATTLTVITVVAVVSFDSLGHVAGVAGTYVVLAAIEGQVAQPLLVGRRLEVNPLLIFLGLWFGGLFWGIAGVILATPTLVTLKVIAENAQGGRSMLEFLGPNDQTPAAMRGCAALPGVAIAPPERCADLFCLFCQTRHCRVGGECRRRVNQGNAPAL